MQALTQVRSRSFWNALLREPLLHFVLIGGSIFAVDQRAGGRRDDPTVIVVGPEVEREAREIFHGAQGREPTAAELKILRARWIDNEILYREGLALRLEQGDPALRERVIFKALNMIESNLRIPTVDDAALRQWFERHRSEYDTPARFDFAEAVMTGDKSTDTARRFADALNTGAQADVQSGLRLFKSRPRNTIVDSFGAEFAVALDQVPIAQWQVLQSKDGPRVVRLETRSAGELADFEDVRARVRQDWQDAKAQELRSAAVRELGKKYKVQLAGTKS